MAKLIRIDNFISQLILDGNLSANDYKVKLSGSSGAFFLEYNKIENNIIYFESSLFRLERALISAGVDISIIVLLNEGVVLSEKVSVDPVYFKNIIDLTSPDFFPPFRYGDYKKPKNFAVFTHVYNENFFIKVFINYYKKLTDPSNIFIINHGSDDLDIQYILNSGCQIVSIPRGSVDHLNIKKYVEYFQRFLLTQYNWILSVDCDELLVHNKGIDNFNYFLNNNNDKCIIKPGLGVDLIHNPDLELEIGDFSKISEHRRFYKISSEYAKPLMASIPVTWGLGFHYSINEDQIVVNFDLSLVHLAHVSINEKLIKNNRWNRIEKSLGDAFYVEQKRAATYEDIANEHRSLLSGNNFLNLQKYMIGQF